MSSTRISYHINAPRTIVYRALLDARAVAKWKVPGGMTCHVHEFDAREGGSIRISLTYDAFSSQLPRLSGVTDLLNQNEPSTTCNTWPGTPTRRPRKSTTGGGAT